MQTILFSVPEPSWVTQAVFVIWAGGVVYCKTSRPKRVTQAMQSDLGHGTGPGLCNVTEAMKCDLGHAMWPRQYLVTSAVLWP